MDDPASGPSRAIARGLRARDPVVLEALFDRHKDRLFRYLLRLARDRQTAEDLFQDTWLRVLDRGHQYVPSGSFVAWLLTIARHLYIDFLRKTAPARLLELQPSADGDGPALDPAGFVEDRQPSPLDQLVAQERQRRVEDRFERLPPAVQEVLTLRLDQGLSLDEIARVTAAPLPTVKARLYRGASALAEAGQGVRR
jgi:RNA polymerase sigma-70 factor, ECF subfamily